MHDHHKSLRTGLASRHIERSMHRPTPHARRGRSGGVQATSVTSRHINVDLDLFGGSGYSTALLLLGALLRGTQFLVPAFLPITSNCHAGSPSHCDHGRGQAARQAAQTPTDRDVAQHLRCCGMDEESEDEQPQRKCIEVVHSPALRPHHKGVYHEPNHGNAES